MRVSSRMLAVAAGVILRALWRALLVYRRAALPALNAPEIAEREAARLREACVAHRQWRNLVAPRWRGRPPAAGFVERRLFAGSTMRVARGS